MSNADGAGSSSRDRADLWMAALVMMLAIGLVSCAETEPRGVAAPGPTPTSVDARVVVDEPTLPNEEAFEFAAVAPNADELDRQWRRFRLRAELVEVDFSTHVLLLVGFGESGSCPYEHAWVEIDPAAKLVSLADGGDRGGACTDDYNPRTIGLSISRDALPDGVFQVKPPYGAAVSLAAGPVERPPQEHPDVVSASVSDAFVMLDPEPVPAGGRLRVSVRNETEERMAGSRLVRLDRWTGLGFEPAAPPQVTGGGGVMIAGPGAEEPLLTIDLASQGLEPGWYRVTVDLDVVTGDEGRLLIRRAVEIVGSARR